MKHVLAGVLTLTSSATVAFTTDGVAWEQVPAGTPVTIEPGGTVIARNEADESWVSGPSEVQLLSSPVLAGPVPGPPVPAGWHPREADVRGDIQLVDGERVLELRRLDAVPGLSVLPPDDSRQLGLLLDTSSLFLVRRYPGDVLEVTGAGDGGDLYVLAVGPVAS